MATLFDYLLWRGDLPVTVDPFGEVDAAILSEISYCDFSGIIPGDGSYITLKEASDALFRRNTKEELKAEISLTKMAPFLLEKCAETARFRDVQVGNYINELSLDAGKQISAMTFLPGDGCAYVVYRGTDNTLIGWKEDFLFSYRSGTEGQERAVSYLEEAASRTSRPLRLAGHSKGGNFAVFAATQASQKVRDRILCVWAQDGPGFREDILASDGYKEMRERLISIVPESSVIGMLMGHDSRREIIKSSARGIMQHDLLSWQVLGKRLERSGRLSDSCIFTDLTIRKWLTDIDDKTRASFVDSLFQLLEAGWANSPLEHPEFKISSAFNMLAAMKNMPGEKISEFWKILFKLMKSGDLVLAEGLEHSIKEKIESISAKRLPG